MSRYGAEQLFVIAAKVRRVFVAHAESRARRVHVFTEHKSTCFLDLYLFLKLHALEIDETTAEPKVSLATLNSITTSIG